MRCISRFTYGYKEDISRKVEYLISMLRIGLSQNSNHFYIKHIFNLKWPIYKVGCIYPMVILSEFRMGQNWDDDHRVDAPHFIKNYLPKIFRVAKAPNSDCNMCCIFLNWQKFLHEEFRSLSKSQNHFFRKKMSFSDENLKWNVLNWKFL